MSNIIDLFPCLLISAFNVFLKVCFFGRDDVFTTRRVRWGSRTNVVTFCVQNSYPVLYTRAPLIFPVFTYVGLEYSMVFHVRGSSISSRFQLLLISLTNGFRWCARSTYSVVNTRCQYIVVLFVQVVINP